MAIHFLREIDAVGMFVADHPFWDDGAKDAVPAVPAVLAKDGTVITPAIPEVPAVPAAPIPANMISTPVPEGLGWPKWNGSAWVEGKDPAEVAAQAAIQTRETAKAERAAKVAAITVTTSTGKVFDGDETSQTRMARAIIGMQAAGAPTINWTLSNNTNTPVTVAELTEAMVLAGQTQAAMWPI